MYDREQEREVTTMPNIMFVCHGTKRAASEKWRRYQENRGRAVRFTPFYTPFVSDFEEQKSLI